MKKFCSSSIQTEKFPPLHKTAHAALSVPDYSIPPLYEKTYGGVVSASQACTVGPFQRAATSGFAITGSSRVAFDRTEEKSHVDKKLIHEGFDSYQVNVPRFRKVEYVDKLVKIPFIQTVDTYVDKIELREVLKLIPKPVVQYVEKVEFVPEIVFQDKIVEVPLIIEIDKIVEKVRYIEVFKTVPKYEVKKIPKFVEVPVVKIVDKFKEVVDFSCPIPSFGPQGTQNGIGPQFRRSATHVVMKPEQKHCSTSGKLDKNYAFCRNQTIGFPNVVPYQQYVICGQPNGNMSSHFHENVLTSPYYGTPQNLSAPFNQYNPVPFKQFSTPLLYSNVAEKVAAPWNTTAVFRPGA